MMNLYQQLMCRFYCSSLYNNILMNGLVYNRRYYRYRSGTHRSLSDVNLDYRDFVLWIIIIGSIVWLAISKRFSKTVRYIVAVVPAVAALVLLPLVISHFKTILFTAAASVVGVFLFQKFTNADPDYNGSYISLAATDYIFASGVITATAELLILMA